MICPKAELFGEINKKLAKHRTLCYNVKRSFLKKGGFYHESQIFSKTDLRKMQSY